MSWSRPSHSTSHSLRAPAPLPATAPAVMDGTDNTTRGAQVRCGPSCRSQVEHSSKTT